MAWFHVLSTGRANLQMSKMRVFTVFKARRYSTWRMGMEVSRCCPPPRNTALSWWDLQTEGIIHQFKKVLLRKSDKFLRFWHHSERKAERCDHLPKTKGGYASFLSAFSLECCKLWLLLSLRVYMCCSYAAALHGNWVVFFLLEFFHCKHVFVFDFFCP